MAAATVERLLLNHWVSVNEQLAWNHLNLALGTWLKTGGKLGTLGDNDGTSVTNMLPWWEMLIWGRLSLFGGRGNMGNLCTTPSILLWTWNCSKKSESLFKKWHRHMEAASSIKMGMPTTAREEDLKGLFNQGQWVEGSRRQVLGQCKGELSNLYRRNGLPH